MTTEAIAPPKRPDFEAFAKISRFNRLWIASEKIDGSNAGITIADDGETLWVNSRTKFISVEDDYKGFARWVEQNRAEVLKLGPGRHNGEWWGQGLGEGSRKGYGLKEKRFSLFNSALWGDDAVRPACCHVAPVLASGMDVKVVIDTALGILREKGSQAAPGFMDPEGIVLYHTASGQLFKITLKNDASPKGLVAE